MISAIGARCRRARNLLEQHLHRGRLTEQAAYAAHSRCRERVVGAEWHVAAITAFSKPAIISLSSRGSQSAIRAGIERSEFGIAFPTD